MKPNVLLEAKILKASRKKDGSISLTVNTVGEVDSAEFAKIDEAIGSAGYFAFSDNPDELNELPDEPVSEEGLKTQSQRMRAVLYLLWRESEREDKGGFDEYYKEITNVIIESLKDKIKTEPSF